MRHLEASCLVLIGTGALLAQAGESLPRGVGPEFAKYFSGKSSFQCIGNPSVTIKTSQVNDGVCDCPDGSDEPGTTACAHLDPLSPPQPLANSPSGSTNTTLTLPGFWCANVGHVGMYVPFAFVNDGVCDYSLCCDGTEEYSGVSGVKCENRCDDIGKEYRRIEKEKAGRIEKSLKKRRYMVKEAKELHRQLEVRIINYKSEIEKLKAKEKDLKKNYEEVQKAEAGKTVKQTGAGGKLGVLLGLAKSRVEELKNALQEAMRQRDTLQSKVNELEGILTKFKEDYNPNFNDDGVKAAVHAWEDYAAKLQTEPGPVIQDSDIQFALQDDNESSGIDWKSFEETQDSTDIIYKFELYLPPFLRNILHENLLKARVWLIENGLLADNPMPSGESALETAAREAYEAIGTQIKDKKKELKKEEEDLDKDYGPDHIFRYLKDKCINLDTGEYDYEFCWMGKTTQKSKKGHGNVNMGNFDRIEIEVSDEYERSDGKSLGVGRRLVLKYDNGQSCWNGPRRSTNVWLACAETDQLWRVSESEKCVYKMEVGTPAACEGIEYLKPESQQHDEL